MNRGSLRYLTISSTGVDPSGAGWEPGRFSEPPWFFSAALGWAREPSNTARLGPPPFTVQRTARASELGVALSPVASRVPPGTAPAVRSRHVRRWEAAVADYVDERRRSGTAGPAWLRRIRWELEREPRLFQRLSPAESLRDPREVTEERILALKSQLPWASATFRLHFAALRPFLAWTGSEIARKGRLWAVPSGDASHRRWLSRPALALLFRSAHGRERLLVGLEGLNGLRRVEVLRLRYKDIHLDDAFLHVHGKGRDGGHWRQVPLCPPLVPLLARSLPGHAPEDRLLPLSSSGADLLLQRAAYRAGFPKEGVRVSHHDLRRTFGRLAHEAGMDLVQLKNLFGHASLDQTVHYIGLDQAEMLRGLRRLDTYLRPFLNPRSKVRLGSAGTEGPGPGVVRGRSPALSPSAEPAGASAGRRRYG